MFMIALFAQPSLARTLIEPGPVLPSAAQRSEAYIYFIKRPFFHDRLRGPNLTMRLLNRVYYTRTMTCFPNCEEDAQIGVWLTFIVGFTCSERGERWVRASRRRH